MISWQFFFILFAKLNNLKMSFSLGNDWETQQLARTIPSLRNTTSSGSTRRKFRFPFSFFTFYGPIIIFHSRYIKSTFWAEMQMLTFQLNKWITSIPNEIFLLTLSLKLKLHCYILHSGWIVKLCNFNRSIKYY
jgi:hypothetical protein